MKGSGGSNDLLRSGACAWGMSSYSVLSRGETGRLLYRIVGSGIGGAREPRAEAATSLPEQRAPNPESLL